MPTTRYHVINYLNLKSAAFNYDETRGLYVSACAQPYVSFLDKIINCPKYFTCALAAKDLKYVMSLMKGITFPKSLYTP